MFCIDTAPDGHAFVDSDSDCEVPKFNIPAFRRFVSGTTEFLPEKKDSFHNKSIKLSSSLNAGVNYNKCNYVNIDPEKGLSRDKKLQHETTTKVLNDKLKKSIVGQPEFEKAEKVPVFLSKTTRKKLVAKEREKTKGYQWYNMPAPEMTDEKKNDLLVVQMRQALDPKHFYKRSATKSNPKFFQVGTFVESPIDFYSSRIPKKQRKQTLVQELLADADFRQYQKKKYSEFQRTLPPKFRHRKKEKKTKLSEARANTINSKKSNKRRK